jgi:predicted CXXCH cytochrome family protein
MERAGEEYFMNITYPYGPTKRHEIVRTVGSRRIEQYIAEEGGQYFRLPVAFDLMQNRWISLNGSFFYPDSDNFDQHVAQWDTNCVFCHNVKAQPNMNFDRRTTRSEVAELGIACGACHGPGAVHADLAASPLRRATWYFNESSEKQIVNPVKLDTDRSMMICGHCHGQRVPEPLGRIREIMAKGDPFDAGENLAEYYSPIHAGTRLGDTSFATRFWPDGSPRLTAYEYQGIIGSACFLKGEPGNRLNCLSCHTMHEGDIKGQLRDEMRTNIACTQCHREFQDRAKLTAHTRHSIDSAGSSCYSCHMPEVVYGVQTFHKTHRISVPDAGLTMEKGVPNACNQCHVDKSVNWVVKNSKDFWPERYVGLSAPRDPGFDLAEGVRGLFGGDALTRAMMADSMGRRSDPFWAAPHLSIAFEMENYPIVRYFAANGLALFDRTRTRPDYLASGPMRSLQIASWSALFDPALSREIRNAAETLRRRRIDVDLEVGE